jgi:glycosyltransferase involved in cell wall biosynthesis
MRQALNREGLQIVQLGTPNQYAPWQKKVLRYGQKFKNLFQAESFHPSIPSRWLETVQQQLLQQPCDFILAPIASKEVALLDTSIPILYLSDTTARLFCQEQHYLSSYKGQSGGQGGLDEMAIAFMEQLDAIALAKSTHVIYPSDWAAQSALTDYGLSPSKVSVIPFGANLDQPPMVDAVHYHRRLLPQSPCRLLFVGTNWQRKGGDIAFETLLALHRHHIDAELVVVGTVPPASVHHEKLTVIPNLNKNMPLHRQRLNELFWRSHFFLLPTRAECYGIVLCEANAFGLPVLTTDVGGIATLVENGRNGYKLSLAATGEDYAHLIADILADETHYQTLVTTSRAEYDQRLNWQQWAEQLHQLLYSL